MSSLFSKALVYLGLVDEAEMDPDAPQEQAPVRQSAPPPQRENVRSLAPDEGRRVEPPASASRTSARHSDVPSVAGVRPIRPESRADILVIDEFGLRQRLVEIPRGYGRWSISRPASSTPSTGR